MEITACPKCGSRKIFQGRLKDGVLTGYTSKEVCRDCGYRGIPLIFDDIENYKKFLEALKLEKEGKTIETKDKDIKLSKKEKEVIEFLDNLSEEEKDEIIENKPKILKNSVVWLSIIIIVGSFWITSRGGLLMTYGIALLAVGIILFFVGIISPPGDKQDDSKTSKTTFGGIFLMMAGVLGFISWSNIFYNSEAISMDTLLLQQFGVDVSVETFMSFLFVCSLIGIIFSIFAIFGGIYAIKKKFFTVALVCAVFGILTFGPLFSSTILSVVGLVLIIISKNEFEDRQQI